MNDLFQTVVRLLGHLLLGIIQGVTEVFPISSTAHLALAGELLQDLLGFDGFSFSLVVFLHVGTLLAILHFYRRDVLELWHVFATTVIARVTGRPAAAPLPPGVGYKTPWLMILALLMTLLVAFPLKRWAELVLHNILIVAALMVVNGFILVIVSRAPIGGRKLVDLHAREFLWIGLAQGVAVLPGVSRFGMTLCAGLVLALSWTEALKLSFLLSLPTVLGAIALDLAEHIVSGQSYAQLGMIGLAIGIAAAAATGLLAIRLMLLENLHTRMRLSYIGYYCIMAGVFFFVFFLFLG
jgi:undecaprenyl-diphosphatase